MSDRATPWIERLDAVATRLEALAARDLHGMTAPDDATGEQWEAAQAWGHLAEFGDYWLVELDKVVQADAWPAPFGRTKSDPNRLAAIEAGKERPHDELVGHVRASIARLRAQLESMTDEDWEKTGQHETLGVMTVDDQLQHFHVGHYEEHAEQLESLAS